MAASHDLSSTQGNETQLIIDFRAVRILLETMATGSVDVDDAVLVATESIQQPLRQAAIAPPSTEMSFLDATAFDDAPMCTPDNVDAAVPAEDHSSSTGATIASPVPSVKSDVSATLAAASDEVAPSEANCALQESHVESKVFILLFRNLTNAGSEGEAESDIYTDHNVGATRKSDFQARLEKVSKTKLSGFANSALSFLPRTDVGHILRNQKHEAGRLSSSDGVASLAPQANEPDTLGKEKSSIINHDIEEEDLISFEIIPWHTTRQPSPEAPPDASSAHTATEHVSLLEHAPESEATSVEDVTNTAEVDIARVAAAAAAAAVVAALVIASAIASASKVDVKHTAKCGKSCGVTLVDCACSHKYCQKCLCVLIENSVRGWTPFPPDCCELPLPVDANSPSIDQMILREFFAKKFEVGCKTPTRNDRKFTSVPTPPTDASSKNQQPEFCSSTPHHEEEKLCYLCKKVVAKGAVCPDCCYRCNKSREVCQCPWWKERQFKNNKNTAAYKAFNPTATSFHPSNTRRAKPFGGIFASQNHTVTNLQNRGPNCKHLEFKNIWKPGPCFDCKVNLPAGGWYCLQCHYLLCDKCKVRRRD
ncbi:hypothetical protein ACHAQD_008689 [Fusarium lateritium]